MATEYIVFYSTLAISVLLAIVFTARRGLNVRFSDLLLKIIASASFVGLGLVSVYLNGLTVYGVMVIFAALFGVLGDVFIELKWLEKDNSDTYLNFGFGTFMTQHILLIAAILIKYPMSLLNFAICLIAPIVVFMVSGLAAKFTGMDLGKFKYVSNIYGAMASMTFSVGFMTMTNYGMELSQILFFAGGVSFFASDVILSQIFFTQKGCNRVFVILNHITYYAAQILIAASLFFITN